MVQVIALVAPHSQLMRLATCVFFATVTTVAHASPWQIAVPNDTVLIWRVSDCGQPKIALLWNSPMRCSARLDDLVVDGKVVRDMCGFPFKREGRPPQTWLESVRLNPEWDTVAVSRGWDTGPGMRGVISAACVFRTDDSPVLRPPLRALSGVGVVRSGQIGKPVRGTATRIGTNLVLTAWHVACLASAESDPTLAPTVVAFRKPSDQSAAVRGEPIQATFEEEDDYDIERDAWNDVAIVAGDKYLDYAVLRLVLPPGDSSISQHKSVGDLAKPTALKTGDVAHILGYTNNVFFPRGQVLSTLGRTVAPVAVVYDADRPIDTFYNLPTAPGFSGGPVFDHQFQWRAMHLKALSVDASATLARDFSRPNAGVSINSILKDLSSKTMQKVSVLDDVQNFADMGSANPLLTSCRGQK